MAGDRMRHDFREGDPVRHRSCGEPIRVIGLGATIAVQLPTGEMRAFDPCELEKVQTARIPAAEGASSRVQTISRAWLRRRGSPL